MNISSYKKHVTLPVVWIILGVFYCLPVTLLEFHGVPLGSSFRSFITTGMQWSLLFLCSVALMMLLSTWRVLFAIAFPILLTISGVMTYYHLTVGVMLSPIAIELAMVNNTSMWMSVITPGLCAIFLLSFTIGIAAVYLRWNFVVESKRLSIIGVVIGIGIGIIPLIVVSRIKAPIGARLPYSIYFSTKEFLTNRKAIREQRSTYSDVTAIRNPNSPDIIFIIGESLRSDHLPQNGYFRNTMPRLSAENNLISIKNMFTPHTYTYTSVPHLLTLEKNGDENAAYSEQSFITLISKAGYRSAWFANQDLSESYAYFAHECDTIIHGPSVNSLYSYAKWLDRELLPELFETLSRNDSVPILAVVHTIGSHWWYRSHYTDEQAKYHPEIDGKDVGALSHEQIVNSYDNTIIATDEFLAEIIAKLRKRNAIIFYISDHGESLGEDGTYLHASNNEPLHYPACLIWLSDDFIKNYPEKANVIKRNAEISFKTSSIFPTIIDLADITLSPSITLESSHSIAAIQ